MRVGLVGVAMLLALGLAPGAEGAAPAPCGGVPQIVDPGGDGHHASSDVLAAWLSEANGRLQAVIRVNAGTWLPEHDDAEENGSGFALVFSVGGQSRYVRARAWPSGEVVFDYGAYRPGAGGPFLSSGPTTGEVVHAAYGGTVAIDVPAATGAVAGARLAAPFVLTYDGINGGEPDWVDHAPGGDAPDDGARGADYVVGSCGAGGAAGGGAAGGTVAVRLRAPARVRGGGRVRVRGSVVPGRAGVPVVLRVAGRRVRTLRLASGAGGRFAVGLPVRETTRLRATAEGIGSSTVTVTVSSVVRIRARRLRSGATRIVGRLRPGLPGRVLLLARFGVEPVATRWVRGGRRFGIRLGRGRLSPGRYQVVYVPARGLAKRSTSNTVRVRWGG